jgi:pullulanase
MTRTTTFPAGLLSLLACSGAHAAISPESCDSKSSRPCCQPSAQLRRARRLARPAPAPSPAPPRMASSSSTTPRRRDRRAGRRQGLGQHAGALTLGLFKGSVPAPLAERFKWVGAGPVLQLTRTTCRRWASCTAAAGAGAGRRAGHRARGHARAGGGRAGRPVCGGRNPGQARRRHRRHANKRTSFSVWAPTAQQAAVCVYNTPAAARAVYQMRFDPATGAWSAAMCRAT